MKNYIGKKCWQAVGYACIKFGSIVDQKMEGKWLVLKVNWKKSNDFSWEKINNISFNMEFDK